MKQRLQKEIKLFLLFAAIGFLYLIFVLKTDLRIPCLFYLATGFKCPGCGITRMLTLIATLQFKSAFFMNPVLFVTLPIVATCIVWAEIEYIKNGKRQLPKVCKIFLWFEIFVLITYGVIRNIG